MNKAEFIDALRSQRERLEAALAGMSEAQIAKPGTADHWSVKDVLAHLTFWERMMVDNLERAARGEPPQEEEAETTDALNSRVYLRNRARPLADVLADFRQTYQRLLDVLQALPEETLNGPSPFESPQGQHLWEYVANESPGALQTAHRTNPPVMVSTGVKNTRQNSQATGCRASTAQS